MKTVLASRRTKRAFGPLPRESLASLLYAVQIVTEVGSSELGFPISFRAAPSAGAIHPVHLIVSSPDLAGWHRYDPFQHALVGIVSSVDPAEVRQHVDVAVPCQQGTLIMLVAEPAMTSAKYEDAASLVWRDAGILQGYLSLAAQALKLNFCLLGATGEPWASRLVDKPGLYGVGMALVGGL
ncbi:nitroreductase family protein [Variovorax sp. V15]|uniref:nitroreductase family protein n=1 Tax=Variovorax sp. V15 TaxID=3065952 RepID=UPI0034E89788